MRDRRALAATGGQFFVNGAMTASFIARGPRGSFDAGMVLSSITAADLTSGSYSNTASATATPPQGQGAPSSETSNTVVVKVPAEPAFTVKKSQEIAGSGAVFGQPVFAQGNLFVATKTSGLYDFAP